MTLIHLKFILSHILGYEDPDSVQVTTDSSVKGFTKGCEIDGFANLLKEKESGKNFFESLNRNGLSDNDNGLIVTKISQGGKNITNDKHFY